MTISKKNDTSILISLLKSRDEKTFSSFYDDYSGALYGILCKIVQDDNEAETLLQDTFIKIWKDIDDYDSSKSTLFTWALNIARKTGIDYLRSKNFSQHSASQKSDNYGGVESMDLPNAYLNKIGFEELLSKLDKQHALVIYKLYFEGYTQEEAAAELKIPLDTFKTQSRNALKELRICFEL